jgi:hypothetical protein
VRLDAVWGRITVDRPGGSGDALCSDRVSASAEPAVRTSLLLVLLVLSLALVSGCGCGNEDSCADGSVKGQCGLSGRCVECSSDDHCPSRGRSSKRYLRTTTRMAACSETPDCPEPLICHEQDCVYPEHCTINGECAVDCSPPIMYACKQTEICMESRCVPKCQSDWDCLDGAGTCLGQGYCVFERCEPGGTCPNGSEPVEGTLACH